jgi:hypothetical protein
MITVNGNLIRTSGIYSLFVRLSSVHNANGWAVLSDVPGDNIGSLAQGKFTWNLT